jgi:hypothetical protein
MLVVMLVLLVVTASATLAVYSSQFEIRASGQQRQAMQSRQVAFTGLNTATTTIEMRGGARMLEYQMNRAPMPLGTRLANEEPPVARIAGQEPMSNSNVRFVSTDFVVGRLNLVDRTADPARFGIAGYEPYFVVDVNDGYNVPATFVGGAGGSRVDGNGVHMRYFMTTVTSRGRLTRTGVMDARGGAGATGRFTTAEAGRASHLRRDVFETAATARAISISGPYASM